MKITVPNLLKFIIGSSLGIMMFLVPITSENSFNTLVGLLTDIIKKQAGVFLPIALVVILVLNAIISTFDYIVKPNFIRKNAFLSNLFVSPLLYLVSRIIAAIFAVMVLLQIGPEAIIGQSTGGVMLGLGITIAAMAIPLSYAFPLLTECGIMEFIGILLKPIVRPLFKVPGRASVDLITSWFGASNAAAVFTREQYRGGYYTAREAASIMTNFSLVSVPFCLIVAETLELTHMFPVFYLVICVVGFILAFIMPRIRPLSTVPNTYYNDMETKLNEQVPKNHSAVKYAINQACTVAEKVTLKNILKNGSHIILDLLLNLNPIIVAWGTLGLIIVEYTPIFEIISYPFGVYLNLFGVAEAFAVAPATITGFVDMFIPALLATSITSVETKFIIGVLSLVQIIYMTEVGAVIVQSKVHVSVKKLFAIFLMRTIIAIPIIVLFTKLIF